MNPPFGGRSNKEFVDALLFPLNVKLPLSCCFIVKYLKASLTSLPVKLMTLLSCFTHAFLSLPPRPDDSVLHLTFYYLMNLNIMTVKARVTTATELITPISAGYEQAWRRGTREGAVTRAGVLGCSQFLSPLALRGSCLL